MFRKIVLSLLTVVSFSLAEQKFVIEIEGMGCQMCAKSIQKSLKQISGVKKAKVFFEDNKAIVKASDKVKNDEILKAIQKSGMFKGKILKVQKE